MHPIELAIYKFLQDTNKNGYKISDEILERFSRNTGEALKKQFEREPREFKLYISNIGRPLCQLEFESLGYPYESNIVRNLYGDIAEDIVMFLLYASGINVVSEQEKVSIEINGRTLNGYIDVILDLGDGSKIWDIKSSSGWAFANKFNSFQEILDNDSFGYIDQIFLYGRAKEIKVGGFIIIDKSSGEIKVIQAPDEQDQLSRLLYKKANETSTRLDDFIIRTINNNTINGYRATKAKSTVKTTAIHSNIHEYIDKQFNPTVEFFRSKPTGNKTLNDKCNFCSHKFSCWPTLQLKPKAKSTAKNPTLTYYVEYHDV